MHASSSAFRKFGEGPNADIIDLLARGTGGIVVGLPGIQYYEVPEMGSAIVNTPQTQMHVFRLAPSAII
jgi:hypothetical protein